MQHLYCIQYTNTIAMVSKSFALPSILPQNRLAASSGSMQRLQVQWKPWWQSLQFMNCKENRFFQIFCWWISDLKAITSKTNVVALKGSHFIPSWPRSLLENSQQMWWGVWDPPRKMEILRFLLPSSQTGAVWKWFKPFFFLKKKSKWCPTLLTIFLLVETSPNIKQSALDLSR